MPETLRTPAEEIASSVTAEAFPVELKERGRPRSRSGEPKNSSASPDNIIGPNWPSLLVPSTSASPSASPIPPEQATRNSFQSPPRTSASWKIQKKDPEDYERDRLGKYAQYFKGNEILPNPELSKVSTTLESSGLGKIRILSLVVFDLKTRRLTGLQKDIFEEILRNACIPCQFFCRRGFASWDVLLPTKAQTAKLVRSCISTKSF